MFGASLVDFAGELKSFGNLRDFYNESERIATSFPLLKTIASVYLNIPFSSVNLNDYFPKSNSKNPDNK